MGYRRLGSGGSWTDIGVTILGIIGVVLMGILGVAGILLLIVAIMAIPGAVCALLWTIAAPSIAIATGTTWPTAFTFWPAFAVFTILSGLLGSAFMGSKAEMKVATHPDKDGEIQMLRAAIVTSSECGPPDACMLYDEEAVEGWRWTHPDGREWTELGEHLSGPPMHPLLRDALKGTDE